jgi:hypothetical protein
MLCIIDEELFESIDVLDRINQLDQARVGVAGCGLADTVVPLFEQSQDVLDYDISLYLVVDPQHFDGL